MKVKKGSTYNELGTSSIESIKYKGENIKSQVSNLQVSATSAKKVTGNSVSINNITDEIGAYTINYKVTFTYKGNNITKTFIQSIAVY